MRLILLSKILTKGDHLRLIKISSLLIVFALVFTSCQDDPTSLGKDFIGNELEILEINSMTDSLNQTTNTYMADSISYGSSDKVLLGNLDYVKSTMLLRFGNILPDSTINSIDSSYLTVLSAEVQLRPNYKIGDRSQLPNFTVHEITSDWGTVNFNIDSLAMLSYDLAELTDSKSITDSLITFNVNNDIALKWLKSMAGDSTANNYGMMFIPQTGSNIIYGFRGFSTSVYENSPRLRYIVQNEDSKLDTLTTYVVFDTHVPEGTVPVVDNNKMQLVAGLGERGKLYFDLSSIPINVNINKAELTLFVDSLSSVVGSPDADSLRVHFFADSSMNEFDTDENIQRLSYNDYEFKGTITEFVQSIVTGKVNQGFSLTLSNEITAVDRYVIYGSNYPDINLRPRLKIYYNEFN